MATTWNLDPNHTEVKFKVKHLVISSVTGYFSNFNGTVETTQADFSDAKVSFEADINSISTKNEQRDGHLKSADFFDAANHPKLTFVSTSISKKDDRDYQLNGNLTIRGVTKSITLDAEYNGTVKGFGVDDVAAFELEGKINRKDFGLIWNGLTETGGVVVGDEVKLDITAELVKS
ncbi:YceI family protein [Solitalea canadensis]|uniref:Lipid/polyisoprenoid-binding YceI-like domain-containing protein n=1 Tax=Solitalea canadensis (strain ATCC 29591 / DSM 3403 / JCM 21819 / LMG 8368 / NBRC 15130 / NCIMB 12057 / USAM 9D) TaxID=929556 RepID=H8KXI5_SOLCM|nr:YceI family protein [Solitalea canadensis]AFD08514.1 hypothetical protein Solca_3509 [Solitalea canadensis DSM 3403]